MASRSVDFALFGASPLANLFAGLLADRHGKTVVQVAEPEARYRLPRSLDLSVAPLTRPHTWSLLKTLVPETQKLLTRIGGRSALRRLDPMFFADHQEGQEALGHVAQMARAYGTLADRVAAAKTGSNRSAIRLSDALMIDRAALLSPLEKWLTGLNVARVTPEFANLNADGSADLSQGEETIHAARSVLIDDAAIIRHLPAEHWPAVLQRRPHASILTATREHLAGDVMFSLDTGLNLLQIDGGSVAAFGPGALASFSARLAHMLADNGVTQQIGQSGFEGLMSTDGAPLIGSTSESAALLLGALGPTGAFMVPMLARWLVGQVSGAEVEWCEAHAPLSNRQSVAEFASNIGDPAA